MTDWDDFFNTPSTEPAPAVEKDVEGMPSDGNMAFGVIRSIYGNGETCLLQTEDGSELLVSNEILPRPRNGEQMAAFATPEGWSTCNPRWFAYPLAAVAKHFKRPAEELLRILAKEGVGSDAEKWQILDGLDIQTIERKMERNGDVRRIAWCYGSELEFIVTGRSPNGALLGTAGGVPLELDPHTLKFPWFLESYPAENYVYLNRVLDVFVTHPENRPVRVASAKQRATLRFPRMPADACAWKHLEVIVAHYRSLEVRISAFSNDWGVWLGFLGIPGLVSHREEFTWEASPPRLIPSQKTRVAIQVHLENAGAWVSARHLNAEHWQTVRTTFALGQLLYGCRVLHRFSNGMLYECAHSGIKSHAFLPIETESGQTPRMGDENRDLLVVGYDNDKRWLQVELPPAVRETYTAAPGSLIPVQVAWMEGESAIVRWCPAAPLAAATFAQAGDVAGRGSCRLAEVFAPSDANGAPELKLLPQSIEFTVLECVDGTVRVKSATGQTYEFVLEGKRYGQPAADKVELEISHIKFLDAGAKTSAVELFPHKLFEVGNEYVATITEITKGGCLVTVEGYPGFMAQSQFAETDVNDGGDLVDQSFNVVLVSKQRDQLIVSHREWLERRSAMIREDFLSRANVGDVVKGTVTKLVDFGAFVDLGGFEGLLRPKILSESVSIGQSLDVEIRGIARDKRIYLGLKQLQTIPWDEIELRYSVGNIVRGKVTKLFPHGASIELEAGIEGLVHVSELSWTRKNPRASDVLEIGQEIQAAVIDISIEKEQISLSMRQLKPNPWDDIELRYPVGATIKGPVCNLKDYGAFVTLEEGIDAMIHLSDLSWTRKINHPSEMLKKGDEIEAIVLAADKASQRIALGLKQLQKDPWEDIECRFTVGDLVNGTIAKIATFGAFVNLDGGIDGLIHKSELSEDHIERVKDIIRVGDQIEARVIKVDKVERRIGLSIKAVGYPEEKLKKERADFESLRPFSEMESLERACNLAAAASEERGPIIEELVDGENTPASAVTNLVSNHTRHEVARVPVEDRIVVESQLSEATAPSGALILSAPLPAEFQTSPPSADTLGTPRDDRSSLPPGLEDLVHRWLLGEDASHIVELLEEARMPWVASLAAFAESGRFLKPIAEPVPLWGCVPRALLSLSVKDSSSLNPVHLDNLLGALASHPTEVMLALSLSRILPENFVARHGQRFEAWFRRVTFATDAEAEFALALLRLAAAIRREEWERAFRLVGELAGDVNDPALHSMLKDIVARHGEVIKLRSLFFETYRRVLGEAVREGGFAWVVPVTENSSIGFGVRKMALKILRLRALPPGDFANVRRVFTKEAAMLRKLDHPNVVSLVRELPDGAILLEWLPGRPLRPATLGSNAALSAWSADDGLGDEAGFWTLSRVVDLGLRVAGAMCHLQERFGCFIHHDLTPRNLMIDPAAADRGDAEWVKLIDFGLSAAPEFHSVSSVLDSSSVRLWEPYRSPEFADGIHDDPRSDMFSLGTILFQLICRHLPRLNRDPLLEWEREAAPRQLIHQKAEPQVAALVLRLLEVRRDQRPATWGEVEQALNQLARQNH
jgi:small subunit ribosomal protein S1